MYLIERLELSKVVLLHRYRMGIQPHRHKYEKMIAFYQGSLHKLFPLVRCCCSACPVIILAYRHPRHCPPNCCPCHPHQLPTSSSLPVHLLSHPDLLFPVHCSSRLSQLVSLRLPHPLFALSLPVSRFPNTLIPSRLLLSPLLSAHQSPTFPIWCLFGPSLSVVCSDAP